MPYSALCFIFFLNLNLLYLMLSGGTLESVVAHDGRLSEDVVRRFGWDLVKGLKHIHELEIIFSDLTPAKVYVFIQTDVRVITNITTV